jgi:lysophospholipase L1-like esterase
MRRLFVAVGVVAALTAAAVTAEIVARIIEPTNIEEGDTRPLPDPIIGWIPRPGIAHVRTSEFAVEYNINDLNMNDRPVTNVDRALDVRVLALGDSHTFGVGVSWDQAWPLVLDSTLFGALEHREGRVFNGGVAAYSLGQYLQRYRMLRTTLKPHVVLVGVSTATDLFDLLPPRLGGFVYGGDAAREYFDLDATGRLVERRFEPGATPAGSKRAPAKSSGLRVRTWLRRLALYRRVQNSMMAMRLATSIRLPGGDLIWEGPEAVLHRTLSDREAFQWALAEAILRKLAAEVRADHATPVLVLIPYLPEVYDDVWNATFGRSSEYDRFEGSRRLRDMAQRIGAGFIDTTPALIDAARRSNVWLHHHIDKHPTAEGHRVIARAIAAQLATQVPLPVVTPARQIQAAKTR